MNRVLFERQEAGYVLDAGDPRFEHVRGVLRMRIGDVFDVGVLNGPVGKARIVGLGGGHLRVTVEWGERPPPPPPVTLLVGLCRPATVRKILTTAPTLGVRELVFAPADRSDPAYARAGLWQDEAWRRHLIAGVEQAFDTYEPPVRRPASLAEALELVPSAGVRLALDVYEGARRLSRVPLAADQPVCLAVGPERGWSGADRELLRAAGFELVALGPRVLRVETAVVAALALVLAALGVY